MKTRLLCAVGLVIAALASPLLAQPSTDADVTRAEAILKSLQEDKTTEAMKDFDATMVKAISEEKLRAVWQQLTGQFGGVKSIDERRTGEIKGMKAVELILTFDKERLVQRVVFSPDGKVVGLAFQPLTLAILPAAKQ